MCPLCIEVIALEPAEQIVTIEVGRILDRVGALQPALIAPIGKAQLVLLAMLVGRAADLCTDSNAKTTSDRMSGWR